MFLPRNVAVVRDVPMVDREQVKFYWFPQAYNDLPSSYLVRVHSPDGKITAYITDKPELVINKKILPVSHYSWNVLVFSATHYQKYSKSELINIVNNHFNEEARWHYVNDNNAQYLFGVNSLEEGHLSQLSLFYPSGIAFTENPEVYAISNGDAGEIVVVKGERFKKYSYKSKLGMPLKITNLTYTGNGKFIFTDNRDHTINQFLLDNGENIVIAGTPGKLFGNEEFMKYDNNNDGSISTEQKNDLKVELKKNNAVGDNSKLGIFRGLTSIGFNMYISMSAGFKLSSRSWYSMSLGVMDKIYRIKLLNGITNYDPIKGLESLCESDTCLQVWPLIENRWLIRTQNSIKYISSDSTTKWVVPLKSGFGDGLIKIADERYIVIGDHTTLLRIDIVNGEHISLKSNAPFANIVDIQKSSDGTIAIVDSDAFKVYFGYIDADGFHSVKTLGVERAGYPALVQIKSYDDKLLVLTSNPSYLFEYSLRDHSIRFLVGNGTNNYAVPGRTGLSSGMYYPNDVVSTNAGIFITEANHRIIKLDKNNKISIYAGALKHDKKIGQLSCEKPAFSGLKGIIGAKKRILAVDSGNNRLVTITRMGNICNMQELILKDADGKQISLNYPTYISRNGEHYLLVDSNNNRILEFDLNGNIFHQIGETQNRGYQGQGGFNDIPVRVAEALFSTPAGLATNKNKSIFIGDLFNGLIREVKDDQVRNIQIGSSFMPEKYFWPLSIEIVDTEFFLLDSLSNKIYKAPLTALKPVLN